MMGADNYSGVGHEASLQQLLGELWSRKLRILLVAALFAAVAGVYVSLVPPVYEARAVVEPPSKRDIANLNKGRRDMVDRPLFTVDDVFGTYVRVLQSERLRREFFETVYVSQVVKHDVDGTMEDLYAIFNRLLVVREIKGSSHWRFSVQIRARDPQRAADWLARYTSMAGELARDEIIRDIQADLRIRIADLEGRISSDRESATQRREDQIARLSEALSVARSIDLQQPPLVSQGLASEIFSSLNGPLNYMRGSKALEAEILNLKQRTSDDPYIASLRERQSELAFYSHLEFDPASVTVYRQDGAVRVPNRPVSPVKPMMIGGAAAFGMALAGLGVLWRRLRSWERTEQVA